MYFSLAAILSLILIVFFVSAIIGIHLQKQDGPKWIHCEDELPPSHSSIVTYPVAFFDEEFGVVVDQAEYHPNRTDKWLSVPEGHPCHPFAWFDLPYSPWPRQTLYKAYSGNREPKI